MLSRLADDAGRLVGMDRDVPDKPPGVRVEDLGWVGEVRGAPLSIPSPPSHSSASRLPRK